MRKTISQHEIAKARALVEQWNTQAIVNLVAAERRPGYIGMGAYNAVFALTKDLAVRFSRCASDREEGHLLEDNSWDTYRLSQMHPELGLVKVWHMGVVQLLEYGAVRYRAWAIVERCDTTAHNAVHQGKVRDSDVKEFAELEHAKFSDLGLDVWDLHLGNICLSRGKRPRLVITDCHISPV